MTADERRLREDLATLAASEQGRRLLQLGLRGIERGEHGVTAGCWTKRGVAGCLFQHAYWEAVREGIFADAGRPGDWIGNFVGPHDYGIVIQAIASFDRWRGAATRMSSRGRFCLTASASGTPNGTRPSSSYSSRRLAKRKPGRCRKGVTYQRAYRSASTQTQL
jgi:hypothetical protein